MIGVTSPSTENIIKEDDEKVENNHMVKVNGIDENPKTSKFSKLRKTHKEKIKSIISLAIFAIFTGYFIWATYYYFKNTGENFNATSCNGYGFLVILYCFYLYGTLFSYILRPFFVPVIYKKIWAPSAQKLNSIKYGSIIFYTSFLVASIAYLVVDTSDNRTRLIPVGGLCIFILFGYVFSANRSKIPWHTVIWGIILQFVFGLLTIRWEVGRNVFDCAGHKVNLFLSYAVGGSAFVYGDKLVNEYQVFAFRALSTIFFLGFMINILYYYGVMQKVVSLLGQFLQYFMGTSVCESVNSAANIFLGQTEAPLLLKPYLQNLTDSEIHSIMTSGFATVSGTVLAAYVSFGADPANLITSSVMSAPAALCFSKLMYPETEEVRVTQDNIHEVEAEYDSVMDAASKGASDAFHMVSGIISSLVAFLAFIYFVNGVLSWFGVLVGFTEPDEQWTVDLIVGKIFIPVSYIMGVPWEDCENVGILIGLKTIVNEFAAFERMSGMELTGRTKSIATYAICGFSNPGSIGITISALGVLMPNKRDAITKLVFRAFVGGAVVCFMTACIAGALMPDDLITDNGGKSTTLYSTSST